MSELKNTPWVAEKREGCLQGWKVIDSHQWIVASTSNESEAKAIAALPDTLAELDKVKAENERLTKAAQAILNNWESGDGKIRVADLMNDLRNALTHKE